MHHPLESIHITQRRPFFVLPLTLTLMVIIGMQAVSQTHLHDTGNRL